MRWKMLSVILLFCFVLSGGAAYGQATGTEKSDTWLKAQLITSYTLNEFINPFKLDVDVREGIAYISGRVDSEIERDLAVEIARGIEGIREVKENLTLEPADTSREKSDFAGKVEDATLTAKVKYRLMLNKNMNSLDIDVDTENGIVTLSGSVDSKEKRELALRLAQNTEGVKQVVGNLTVEPEKNQEGTADSLERKVENLSQNLQDAWITAKAKSLLMISSEAEGARYDVSTSDGRILIVGEVLSRKQAEDIQMILIDLQGVEDVENRLQVVDR